MKFVFGLGNPGSEYENTRHNAGFMLIDQLAAVLANSAGSITSAGWKSTSKFSAQLWQIGEIFLVKPQTFMNDSGRAIRPVIEYYDKTISFTDNEKLSQVFVIHDDLDLAVGQYKVQLGKGPKVHNGLISAYSYLHTEQFWHVRIGVDGRNGQRTISSADYVLRPFSPDEQPLIQQTFDQVAQELKTKLSV